MIKLHKFLKILRLIIIIPFRLIIKLLKETIFNDKKSVHIYLNSIITNLNRLK